MTVLPLTPKAWMRHWQRAGRPVRYVGRDLNGKLRGFVDKNDLAEFRQNYGEIDIIDLKMEEVPS